MTIWDQVAELVAQGKGATITFTEAQEVKLPKPKNFDYRQHKDRPWETYAASTTGTKRPRCLAVGCQQFLRKDQSAACCKEHEDQLIDDALRILALLKYRLIERLGDYEDHHQDATICKVVKEI